MIKTLLFSSLYPNSQKSRHGIFVETRLRQLLKSEQVETKVIAPIPSFPFKFGPFKRYAAQDIVPEFEVLNEINIYHPRYTVIPKIGQNLAPKKMAAAALPVIKKLIANGFDFDIIDAHYFFPDGVAAAIIAKELNKPLVITARGTDVNLFADYKKSGAMIKSAANQCDAIICVADALKQKLVGKGIDPEKIFVLRNGVDKDVFYPLKPNIRDELRKKLKITQKTILAVGNLTELKGFDLVISSLTQLPEIQAIIIGEGEEGSSLKQQAQDLNLSARVNFIPNVSQAELREYYTAADALVLASSREGMPNVVLEALACGTPVVATNVGGVAEVLTPECGIIIDTRNSDDIADALKKVIQGEYSRDEIAGIGAKNSWQQTTQGQLDIFSRIRDK